MRRGAVKLGYIVLLILIILAVYIPYTIGKNREAEKNRIIQQIYSYGDKVLNYIKDRDTTKLQNEILIDGHQIDLEKVALFLETVSVDSSISNHKWEDIKSKDGNITIYGSSKDEINPKRIKMMLIKKDNKLLVKAIQIGHNSLESEQEFPFDSFSKIDIKNDNNRSESKGL